MSDADPNVQKENWYEAMRFELRSVISRRFKRDLPQFTAGSNYLNLGSGNRIVDGFMNADFFGSLRPFSKKSKLQWELDLRYPLNCPDKKFDGVFTSHVMEHLYPDEAGKLLSELHRVMKKGAKIRIVVPDLETYIQFYRGDIAAEMLGSFESKFPRKAMALRNLTQVFQHRMVWDFAEMQHYLTAAGFKNINRRSFQDSSDENLLCDLKNRDWESLYVEAEK